MKTFTLNENYLIVCEWKKTRNGFKHEAVLLINGYEVERAKCTYCNRTWEFFEYETVILKVIRSYFDNDVLQVYIDKVKTFR